MYRGNDTLGLWAAPEMREFHGIGTKRMTQKATYQDFRRFQVKTEETIKVPNNGV
jgi:hypothetical protein